MILKTSITPKTENKYGRFFLFKEADGDEEEQPKSNVKIVEAKPDRSKQDFTDGAEDTDAPDDNQTSDDTDTGGEDFTSDAEGNDDNTEDDYTSGAEGEPADNTDGDNNDTTDTAGDTNNDTGDQNTDDQTQTNDGGDGSDGGGTEEINADDGNTDDASDTGDDTDFTDGAEGSDSGGDDSGGDNGGGDSGDDNKDSKGPGLDYDSTRKYNLYKEFMSIYNSINDYISKLENNVKDDVTQNQVYKLACNNLRELKDLCFDYMTMKFEISTYVQSLIFYQKIVVAIQLVFNLIENANKQKKLAIDKKTGKKPESNSKKTDDDTETKQSNKT